jgi:hypothetical protein
MKAKPKLSKHEQMDQDLGRTPFFKASLEEQTERVRFAEKMFPPEDSGEMARDELIAQSLGIESYQYLEFLMAEQGNG